MDAKTKTVLIVEDNELNMKLFATGLGAVAIRVVRCRQWRHRQTLHPLTIAAETAIAAARLRHKWRPQTIRRPTTTATIAVARRIGKTEATALTKA
jgi:hypothetical protein